MHEDCWGNLYQEGRINNFMVNKGDDGSILTLAETSIYVEIYAMHISPIKQITLLNIETAYQKERENDHIQSSKYSIAAPSNSPNDSPRARAGDSIKNTNAKFKKEPKPVYPGNSLFVTRAPHSHLPDQPAHFLFYLLPLIIYSLETSRPKALDLSQSRTTKTRLRVLKHMLKYALLQNRYVKLPPVAKLPFNQLTSATALSLPMYAMEP